MLGYDSHDNRFITKATGYDVKRTGANDSSKNILFVDKDERARMERKAEIKPCFIAFDILYLNGEVSVSD